MLRHEGKERNFATDWWLGCSLATIAGAVNSAGFIAVGYYSANMTGNLSTFSMAFHDGRFGLAASCAALVVAFVSGAMLATVLVNAGHRYGAVSIYAWGVLLEAFLLAVLGLMDGFLPPALRDPALAYGLSFLMGLQNATVTRISGARVRTTHMTGMLTDVGIELADWLDSFVSPMEPEQQARIRQRFLLHAGIVLSFTVGGIGGAFLYGWFGAGFLLVIALCLAFIAAPGVRLSTPVSDPAPR
jgi:uncharacterized membrane protein YoaK (UPF0700 family)